MQNNGIITDDLHWDEPSARKLCLSANFHVIECSHQSDFTKMKEKKIWQNKAANTHTKTTVRRLQFPLLSLSLGAMWTFLKVDRILWIFKFFLSSIDFKRWGIALIASNIVILFSSVSFLVQSTTVFNRFAHCIIIEWTWTTKQSW